MTASEPNAKHLQQAGLAVYAYKDPHGEDVMRAWDLRAVESSETYMARYQRWLAGTATGTRADITARAQLLAEFDNLHPDIRAAIGSLATTGVLLGEGKTSSVYAVEADGAQYAVRKLRSSGPETAADVHEYAALYTAKGMPNVEQIVAASYEQGVTVSELLPGIQSSTMREADLRSITDQQILDLFRLGDELDKRGLGIDVAMNNILYDRKKGFQVVDAGPFFCAPARGVQAAMVVCRPQDIKSGQPPHTATECVLRQQLLDRVVALARDHYRDVRGAGHEVVIGLEYSRLTSAIKTALQRIRKREQAPSPSDVADDMSVGAHRIVLEDRLDQLNGSIIPDITGASSTLFQALQQIVSLLDSTEHTSARDMTYGFLAARAELGHVLGALGVATQKLTAYKDQL